MQEVDKMKRKLYLFKFIVATFLVMSAALCLVGCDDDSKDTKDKAEVEEDEVIDGVDLSDTYWFDREYDEYYYFADDGTAENREDSGELYSEGEYTWDGNEGTMVLDGDLEYTLRLEENYLVINNDDEDTYLTLSPDPFSGVEGMVLPGTGWQAGENTLVFFTDGRCCMGHTEYASVETWFNYEWNEGIGEGTIDSPEGAIRIYYGPDAKLHVQFFGIEDRYAIYEENPNLYDDEYTDEPVEPDNVHMGGYEYAIYGMWENNESDEINIEFEDDNTCWLETEDDYEEYGYAYDGETIFIYDLDTEENLMTGYIDDDGDIIINGLSGWFTYAGQ